jgi:predicted TIM-barrel fold metal-dependent hydrolase
LIVDSHVAGVSRSSRDPEVRQIINSDRFMQTLRRLYTPVHGTMPAFSSIEDYMGAMETLGVEKLVIHSVGYYPETCIVLNDLTRSLCDEHPEKLVGLATTPISYPEDAVNELERAIRDLGLKGLKIYPKYQGTTLDDEKMRPVYEKAEELEVPVLTHSDSYTTSYTGSVLSEIDNTACNTARLFRSNILRNLPKLKMILAHIGGGIVFYRDHLKAMARFLRKTEDEDPGRYFDQIFSQLYYDISPANWYSENTIRTAISSVGEDRLLFGTDFPVPREGMDGVREGIEKVRGFDMPDEVKEKILGQNAKKLFKI